MTRREIAALCLFAVMLLLGGLSVNTAERAARTQDDISGLFMEMSEPTEEERAAGEGVVSVAFRSTEENGGYDVYTWFVDDVQYCLVLHGEASVMTAGEILDGVLAACAPAQHE